MGSSLTVEGSTIREAFEAHVEPVLALTLCAGQIVVMAKLSAYKGEKVRKVIEGQDCELLYLPPYSPSP
jgi:transposase